MLLDIGSQHLAGRPDIFKVNAEKYSESDFIALLADENRRTLIAQEESGELAGYAFCIIKRISNHPVLKDRSYLYIDDFYVAHEFRRHGVGKLLFDAVKELALSLGIPSIELNVWAFNDGAKSFYDNCGMKVQRMEMELALPLIRELDCDELPTALRVIRESFATVANEFGLTRDNCPRHTSFLPIENLVHQSDAGWKMYGLFEGVNLVGYMSLSRENEEAFELHNLAVVPEYRQKGYGAMLLAHAKAEVCRLGGKKITIGIIDESKKLKEWYCSNGFVSTGTIKVESLPFTVGRMEWKA